MFRMCASNSHSYTHLILAVGIVRKPTVWVFITSKYPGTHDIGLPSTSTYPCVARVQLHPPTLTCRMGCTGNPRLNTCHHIISPVAYHRFRVMSEEQRKTGGDFNLSVATRSERSILQAPYNSPANGMCAMIL